MEIHITKEHKTEIKSFYVLRPPNAIFISQTLLPKNKKLMRSKLLLENTTRARKVNKTKEHTASIDGYKHNIVLITATNNENLLSQKFIETTEGQLLM